MKLNIRMLRYAVRNNETYAYKAYSRRIRKGNTSPVPPSHIEMIRWSISMNAYESKWDTYGMYKQWIRNELLIPC